jgi:hypothetical protein
VTAAQDEVMCVRIFHGDLTIQSGVTFTPQHRTKGMFVLVKGNLTVNGAVSMTGKGSSATGRNVYMWGSSLVPAAGALGGVGISISSSSNAYQPGQAPINAGSNRQTGGGGSGGASSTTTGFTSATAQGGTGTSYSGGAGSGGVSISGSASYTSPVLSGVAGGDGYARTTVSVSRAATGGTGVTAGKGKRVLNTTGVGGDYASNDGNTGTGGLLMVLCFGTLSGSGSMTSNGSNGKANTDGATYPLAFGGASGGGSVNVISKTGTVTMTATGGASQTDVAYAAEGGAGGTGSTTTGTFTSESVALPRRTLIQTPDTKLWYRNFSAGTWVEATGSGIAPFESNGMFDGEVKDLTKDVIDDIVGIDMGEVTFLTYE